MASGIIHLAVTKELTKSLPFRDAGRLFLGCVLPDGAADRNRGHLKKSLCDNAKKTYDLNGFRERFAGLIQSDDLFLGYYLHLVQDILFRRFMYVEHGWNPRLPGYVERLHRDYAVTNAAVIRRHGLTPDMVRALEPGPELARLGEFDIPRFVETVRGYFTPAEETECFFFTVDMAEAYIGRAVELCLQELEHLKNGGPLMDSGAWAWDNGPSGQSGK